MRMLPRARTPVNRIETAATAREEVTFLLTFNRKEIMLLLLV
jgi:hypothetical protein